MPLPSKRALEMLEQFKKAVGRHLAMGRSIYGRRNGKPVWIAPKPDHRQETKKPTSDG